MNAQVLLYSEGNVNEFMKKSLDDETFLQDDLAAIDEKQLYTKKKVDNTIADVVSVLDDNEENLLLPYLVYNDKELFIDGYGVFQGDKLKLYLDTKTSTAVDFFRNRLRTYPIYLKNSVGVMVTDSKVSKKLEIVNGIIQVNVQIYFQSDIKEVRDQEAVYQTYYINQIESLQNEYVREMLKNLVDLTKEYHVDLLELKKEARKQYTKDWDSISSKWDRNFEKMNYKYNISSQAAQSYVVGK